MPTWWWTAWTTSFLANVNERAVQLRAGIAKLPHVKSISGIGLMVGIEFYDVTAADVLAACREAGLLVLTAKTRLRLLPPLTLSEHQANPQEKPLLKACFQCLQALQKCRTAAQITSASADTAG